MKKRIVSLSIIACVFAGLVISNVTVNAAKMNTKTTVNEGTTTQAQVKNEADGNFTKEDLKISVHGIDVNLNEDMNKYLADLGDPDDIKQSKTCIGTGMEKVYTYGDIIIYAFEDGKKERIHMIEIQGDAKTSSGISIGSSQNDVKEAYGNSYVDNDVFYSYVTNGNELNFYFTDGKVDSIEMRNEEE